MTVYLLDTDVLIYIRRRRSPEAMARFRELRPGDAGLSIISYGELCYGAQKSLLPERARQGLETLAGLISVLPLPVAAGRAYGEIRAVLERNGNIIGGNDLWIAAHALSAGLTLVSNNTREFKRIPNLKLENWTT